MENGKLYRLTELYEMTYGKELYADFQLNDENKTLWLFVAKTLNLRTYLEVLVILGRLRTGRRKGGRKKKRSTSQGTACSAARWCTTPESESILQG